MKGEYKEMSFFFIFPMFSASVCTCVDNSVICKGTNLGHSVVKGLSISKRQLITEL